ARGEVGGKRVGGGRERAIAEPALAVAHRGRVGRARGMRVHQARDRVVGPEAVAIVRAQALGAQQGQERIRHRLRASAISATNSRGRIGAWVTRTSSGANASSIAE